MLADRFWRLLAVPGLLALGACSGQPTPHLAPEAQPAVNPAWAFAGKARVSEGASAMVVSGNPIASAVGRDVLKAGGNAIDAAVAVGFALAVSHPEAGNIGGGGFMVIRTANGKVRALDYRETAPAHATHDMYLDAAGKPTDKSVTGHLAAGVPGSVAGMLEAHRALGRLPLARVIGPAIALADTGFIIDEYRARSLGSDARLTRYETSMAQFRKNGQPYAAGDRFTQHELATTLKAIRDHGADGFYAGPVAGFIVAEMQRGGGIITLEDLAAYRPLWREPITVAYRGHTIYSMPPASSGGVTLSEMLNILGGYPQLPPFGSTALLHVEAEAMRRAFTDRNHYLGDPAFIKMPLAHLLSHPYADSLRKTIGDRATKTAAFESRIDRGSSTTHYSVVDADGNAVSCTTTLNNSYGSAVTVAGAGFILNDEMDDFATAPGLPNMYGLVQGEANAVEPGKRMLSAMTPSIVLAPDGRLRLVVGTPGGPTIITQVYHVISNVIDHRMTLADAIAAPRMHHQALPDAMTVEKDGFMPGVLDSLRTRGHSVATRIKWGDVEAIERGPAGWIGVSDPRLGGGGAGY